MPPVFTSSSVPPIADGSPDRMLARMIIEMPLPMPRSVICSPSHIRNMLPVTSVTAAVNTNPGPGVSTTFWVCMAVAIAIDWNVQSSTVP
jgi:hypothetical protein